MINYRCIWSIHPSAAHMLETGFAAMVERLAVRIEAARGKVEQPALLTVAGDTGVIDVQGVMVKKEGLWTALGFAVSTEAITRAITEAAANEKIKSIVLNIDSPGGTVDGQHKMVQAVQKARNAKPIFAQVDGMAASAAYWLASQANAIYAGHGDEVGSIGVRMLLYDFSKMFEGMGVEAVAIDTGAYKSLGAEGTEITADQRAYLQGQVDAYFEDFLGDVRKGRVMTKEQAAEVSDGRMFLAKQAKASGLIDGIQSLDDTLRTARRYTGKSTGAAKARARLRDLVEC